MRKLYDELALYTKLKGPGLVYAVIRNGFVEVLHSGGYADLQSHAPLTAHSVFNIASNSKAFTAASLLILARTGVINYDDSVKKFIPELPAYADSIQVKHLIYHSSGLPHYVPLFHSPNPVTNHEVIQFLLEESGLYFDPGTAIGYSNTGYVLLAELVQRLSGDEFPSFIKKNIFDPLGMQSSWVLGLNSIAASNDKAIGYDPWPGFHRNDFSTADFVYGDGGFMVSMTDYVRWVAALNEPGFFSLEEIQKMFSPGCDSSGNLLRYQAESESFSFENLHYFTRNSLPDSPAYYGFGWILGELDHQPLYCHGGAWCGYRSAVAFAPKQRLWVAVFSNYSGISRERILAQALKEYL